MYSTKCFILYTIKYKGAAKVWGEDAVSESPFLHENEKFSRSVATR